MSQGAAVRTLAVIPFAVVAVMVSAQEPAPVYRVPSPELTAIVDAKPLPGVSLSPDRNTMLLMERSGLPTIAELAQPELRIAGLRINPKTNGPSRNRPYTALALVDLATKSKRAVSGLPESAAIGNVSWSPDGASIAFTITREDGIELWLADASRARAKRLIQHDVNDAYGAPFEWLPDSEGLVVKSVLARREEPLPAANVPAGPVIQETTGEVAAARTYQDLLENRHDEALFEFFATSQLLLVNVSGKTKKLGNPGIIRRAEPSPDGRYLLVDTVHKPFSYLVPHYRFPHRIDVWDLRGEPVKTIADLPLAESVPIGRGAVPTGIRSISWRADADATLAWVEAQDGGDPRAEADVRDTVFTLHAPFTDDPAPLISLGLRFAGFDWGAGDTALVNESWWATRTVRTWRVAPDGGREPELIFDRSYEDRYADPGSPVNTRTESGRPVLMLDGDTIYLSGAGASPEGDRPFLDRFNLSTKQSERLWRSEAPYYERFVTFLDDTPSSFLTSRESPAEPPNYFARRIGADTVEKISDFPHPYPQLADLQKEIIQYEREDGVSLSATLYLPPGKTAEDGPFPLLMWAYPREYKDAEAAGQMRGSPYRFNYIGAGGPLPYLVSGYAILDGPTMPVVGEGETEPNDTYVKQLVASAEAAINEVVRRGVAERGHIGIGGHSYGAFMTANLLAHCDLFAAGIARSGAYNRTLTPFGFQAEERTFWENPDVYFRMSPFMHADLVNEPILLIHGQADNNSGTFPLQSERFYNALKGHGAIARLVMLPHESHGYAARESVLHVLWETNAWLDQYVRNYPG